MDIGKLATDGLSSLLSGGTLGIFGAIGTGILNYHRTKQKNAHALAVMAAQKEQIVAAGQSQAVIEQLKMAAASYDHDKATYADAGTVDAVRGLTRPILTAYMVLWTTVIASVALYQVGLEKEFMKQIAEFAVKINMNLTGICVVWWFGGREQRKLML